MALIFSSNGYICHTADLHSSTMTEGCQLHDCHVWLLVTILIPECSLTFNLPLILPPRRPRVTDPDSPSPFTSIVRLRPSTVHRLGDFHHLDLVQNPFHKTSKSSPRVSLAPRLDLDPSTRHLCQI